MYRYFVILLLLSGLFCFLFPASDTASLPIESYGYSRQDLNNNGIIDAFENGQVATSSDSVKQGTSITNDRLINQREGHRNTHGAHGTQLDRGQSPHTH